MVPARTGARVFRPKADRGSQHDRGQQISSRPWPERSCRSPEAGLDGTID
jgi:hypothetical protein